MSFDGALLDPELTEAFAVFVVGVLGLLLYGGIRLYSMFVILSWVVTVIIFFGVILYSVPIVLFYFAIIVTATLIGIASIRYARVA